MADQIFVNTDHRPLISIMSKEIAKIGSSRLQRMRLKLLLYNINLSYVPGKYLFIADLLSRSYNKSEKQENTNDLNEVVHTVNVSDDRISNIKNAILNDLSMQDLKQVVINGWPSDKSKIKDSVKCFWKHKNDIYFENDLLFLNDRIILPKNFGRELISIIHEGHQGIEKTKRRACELFYWFGMNSDVEHFVENCKICQKFLPSNIKEPFLGLT